MMSTAAKLALIFDGDRHGKLIKFGFRCFQKLGVFLGVPRKRIMVYCGLYWGYPYFGYPYLNFGKLPYVQQMRSRGTGDDMLASLALQAKYARSKTCH